MPVSPPPVAALRLPAAPGLRWSARIVDVDTGQVLFSHDAQDVLKTASIGKLFLLAEVVALAESGQLRLDEPLRRSAADLMDDSGLWYLMRQASLPMADACLLVGAVSDNTATNALLTRVGLPAVAERTRRLGYRRSGLLDRVRRGPRGPADPIDMSVGCASELADFLVRLARGEIVSREASARIAGWLAADTDCSMIASAFGLDPLAHREPDRGIELRHKTGTEHDVRCDVGYVRGPARRLAYAVLANWADPSDARPTDARLSDLRDLVLAAMGEVGRAVRAEVLGIAPKEPDPDAAAGASVVESRPAQKSGSEQSSEQETAR